MYLQCKAHPVNVEEKKTKKKLRHMMYLAYFLKVKSAREDGSCMKIYGFFKVLLLLRVNS